MSLDNSLIKVETDAAGYTQAGWQGSTNSTLPYMQPLPANYGQSLQDKVNNDIKEIKPLSFYLNHRHDAVKYIGYDFRGKIFQNTMSSMWFMEFKRASILQRYEKPLSWLVDQIKWVRKFFNYTLESDYRDFN